MKFQPIVLTILTMVVCFIAWRVWLIESSLRPLINTLDIVKHFLP